MDNIEIEITKTYHDDAKTRIRSITYHKKYNESYLHNPDGPAYVEYNVDGNIEYEAWWINDQRHNDKGFAKIKYDIDGSILATSYRIKGKPISELQFLRYRQQQAMINEIDKIIG